ncbi:MAG: phosphatidate cytidylyltransferase [Bacteroides sp.]|nr:phosphatidate cytidylyltransferase [Ruminococcus flavefaciens]MCM1555379.1 phosphatidate cytidylyltransferase [Bacteroides sp.]
MSELLKRTLTGAVIVAAIVGAALVGEFYLLGLLCLLWIFCCVEISRLCATGWGKALGVLYVTLGWFCVWLLDVMMRTYGLIGFFVLIWCSDIFAYLTGSLWGRHKLCPKVSPSKTWEGAAGGFLFAMLFASLWKMFFLPGTASLRWLVFSVFTIVAGMAGDLLESKLKRKAGVKDSGSFLPGHGGMMDRFDSVLLAAPVASLIWFILNLF